MAYLLDILRGMWEVTGDMAPYLLFGFLTAGILSVIFSPEWIERHLGGRGFLPVLKSVLLGVPLPLCSCGVIAVTASIRRHGASRGAATGFLLATPQTGVDSILATWGMLGPVMGVLRPVIALFTGLIGGVLVDWLDTKNESGQHNGHANGPACTDECCTPGPKSNVLVRVFRYGFVTLPQDIGNSLVVGIIIAGLLGALVAEDALKPYIGGGLGAMLAMIALGIPLYVCSTASIPIAVGFMHAGASPGAALAFLISGPATNAATIAMVWTTMGRKTALIYLGTVFFGSLAAGLGFDLLSGQFEALGFACTTHFHDLEASRFNQICAIALVIIILGNLAAVWRKRLASSKPIPKEEPIMGERMTLQVTGMTCSHCENSVRRGLGALPGVSEVRADRLANQVAISGIGLDIAEITRVVRELGYSVESQA